MKFLFKLMFLLVISSHASNINKKDPGVFEFVISTTDNKCKEFFSDRPSRALIESLFIHMSSHPEVTLRGQRLIEIGRIEPVVVTLVEGRPLKGYALFDLSVRDQRNILKLNFVFTNLGKEEIDLFAGKFYKDYLARLEIGHELIRSAQIGLITDDQMAKKVIKAIPEIQNTSDNINVLEVVFIGLPAIKNEIAVIDVVEQYVGK